MVDKATVKIVFNVDRNDDAEVDSDLRGYRRAGGGVRYSTYCTVRRTYRTVEFSSEADDDERHPQHSRAACALRTVRAVVYCTYQYLMYL